MSLSSDCSGITICPHSKRLSSFCHIVSAVSHHVTQYYFGEVTMTKHPLRAICCGECGLQCWGCYAAEFGIKILASEARSWAVGCDLHLGAVTKGHGPTGPQHASLSTVLSAHSPVFRVPCNCLNSLISLSLPRAQDLEPGSPRE